MMGQGYLKIYILALSLLPSMNEVPKSLRVWFIAHFIIDILFALPMIIAPVWILSFFGIAAEPVTARLVGAALVGIGGASLIMKDADRQSYDALLWVKILWSVTAIIGMVLSIVQGSSQLVWVAVGIFAMFSSVWMYYKGRLQD